MLYWFSILSNIGVSNWFKNTIFIIMQGTVSRAVNAKNLNFVIKGEVDFSGTRISPKESCPTKMLLTKNSYFAILKICHNHADSNTKHLKNEFPILKKSHVVS